MNILFLTLQYDVKKEKEYLAKSRSGLQAAANTFQNNLISGFQGKDCSLTIMNTLPVSPYPRYRQLIFNTKEGELCGFKNIEIGYINLPFIKQYARTSNYKKQVRKWIENTEGEKCIIVYSLYLPFEKIAKYVKQNYPDVRTVLVCTDLPCEYGILPKNRLKAALQMSYGKKTLKYAEHFDSFVLLTDAMKGPLAVGDRSYTVVEGVADLSKKPKSISFPEEEKVILYTGTLMEECGIKQLLAAFKDIQSRDYRLWICGTGGCEEDVRAAAALDDRITFFGFVTKEKVYELQEKATLLINPRPNEEAFTKYSFPSKTMEYMLSGKPVLMFRLEGIPKEYDDHIYYFDGKTPDSMARRIKWVCEKPADELKTFGKKAQDFIGENCSSSHQADKIISLIRHMHIH